jgi:hypothetical protein
MKGWRPSALAKGSKTGSGFLADAILPDIGSNRLSLRAL